MRSTLLRLRNNLPLQDLSPTDRQVLIFCVGLALVFWLILNLSQDYRVDRTVYITYQTGPDRVMAGTPPRSIPIQLTGSGWNLIWESLTGKDIDVRIDVMEEQELLLSSSLLLQEVGRKLSSGDFSVEDLGYESRTVYTTPLGGKTVPIIPNVSIEFRPGYFSPGGVRLTPDSVTVSAAADVLDTIDGWSMEAVELTDVENSRAVIVPLQVPGEGISLNYRDVRVDVDVEAFIEQELQVPIDVRHAPRLDSFRIYPSVVSVTLTISQSEFGRYAASDFRVEADLDRAQRVADHNTVPLELTRVPETIKSVRFHPRAVEYYLFRRGGN